MLMVFPGDYSESRQLLSVYKLWAQPTKMESGMSSISVGFSLAAVDGCCAPALLPLRDDSQTGCFSPS
jgi:hypothetical protein